MGPTGVRMWRSIGGVALGPTLLFLSITGVPTAYKPVVYAAAAVVSLVGLLWALKIVNRLWLLNTYTAGVAVVGLISASGIDSTSGLGFLTTGFAGLVCVGIWIALLRAGRQDRPPHWRRSPSWWIVPIIAITALVVSARTADLRFDDSRTELTAFADQQLAIPLKGDGTGRCETFTPSRRVGRSGLSHQSQRCSWARAPLIAGKAKWRRFPSKVGSAGWNNSAPDANKASSHEALGLASHCCGPRRAGRTRTRVRSRCATSTPTESPTSWWQP